MPDRMDRPFLMGSETEYAVSGRRGGQDLDPDDVYELLVEAVGRERCAVPDHSGYRGLYLEHGGRLYLDYGSHPEHATPECFTPEQVACYDKAGEYLLDLARRRVTAEEPGLRVAVIKNNLDPVDPAGVSYGTHESYTCWVPPEEAAHQLLPHLVSRVVYSGSGGLTAHARSDGFELSQRARHLAVAVGDDTTSNRAIFSTRVRRVSDESEDGWTRVHLIGKDSQRAPLGTYLTFATTGLLIEMLNRGHKVGEGLALADPVSALRKLSRDPWLKARVPLADGRELSALEVQAAYLEEAERAVQRGGMPGWAPEAVRRWRQTLEELGRDPLRLADRLDAYCKLLIYGHELDRAGLRWADLRQALEKLSALRAAVGAEVVAAVLKESDAGLGAEERAQYEQAMQALAGQARLPEQLRFAVRLQALDVRYHELGGLYDRLRGAGRIKDVVLSPAEVERASRTPPAGGRAAVRGAWVREHREGDWWGDWQYLWQAGGGKCVDLRDPFSGGLRLTKLDVPEGAAPEGVDVLELLALGDAESAGVGQPAGA